MRGIAVLLIALLLLPGVSSAASVTYMYAGTQDTLVNPFIGNAAWASDVSERSQPFTLVYANLTWADFEPEAGVFDFETFEAENHFARWRAEGKTLILRFVMDIPGGKKHRDIPDWLYQMTKDGKEYSVSYGKGYCPNYENDTLIAHHARAVAALGARYDGDGFVSFVELGSLGHWGEWHVHDKAGVMPPENVRDAYANAYTDAFPTTILMMRRPFRYAAEHGMGLYNDASAEPEATEQWLAWIAEGGAYDQTGEKDALTPMPDAWKRAPVGGELTTNVKIKKLLTTDLAQTLSLYARSHASWIGPGSFLDGVEGGGDMQDALDRVNRTLGYRLRVSRAEVRLEDAGARVFITFVNDGVAPFYFDWTPCARAVYADGSARVTPLGLNLIDVLPGAEVTAEWFIEAPFPACEAQVGIVDPDTGLASVALAMDVSRSDNWYTLFALTP